MWPSYKNEETDQGSFLKKDTWAQGFAHRRHTLKLFTWPRVWLANETGGIFEVEDEGRGVLCLGKDDHPEVYREVLKHKKHWPDSLFKSSNRKNDLEEGENGSFVIGAERCRRECGIKRHLVTDFK